MFNVYGATSMMITTTIGSQNLEYLVSVNLHYYQRCIV